jgi:hypothetical protein
MHLRIKAFTKNAHSKEVIAKFNALALAVLNELISKREQFGFSFIIGKPSVYSGYSGVSSIVSVDMESSAGWKPEEYKAGAEEAYQFMLRLILSRFADLEPFADLGIILQDQVASFSIRLQNKANVAWRNSGVEIAS